MVQTNIIKIKDWCDSNLLSFNVSKTNVLTFKCQMNDIFLNGDVIENVQANKFLGVHIDNKLKFETHVFNLNKKLARNCFALKVIARNLDFLTTRAIYFSLIEAHLRYGVCFWGSCSGFLFNSVFLLQKRAIRFIHNAKVRDTCRPLFLSSGILTLPCLFILEMVCMIHKKYKINLATSPYITRNINTISLPIPTSTLTKKSFIYDGKKLFNPLPERIRTIVLLN